MDEVKVQTETEQTHGFKQRNYNNKSVNEMRWNFLKLFALATCSGEYNRSKEGNRLNTNKVVKKDVICWTHDITYQHR